MSSTTNNSHLPDRSQPATTTESSVSSQKLTSSGLNNGHNKTSSGGRRKDGGRPDLLAMTPSRNASINSNSGSPSPQLKNRNRYYESRLKDHINQLKSERASLQQQFDIQRLADLLSTFHLDSEGLKEAATFIAKCKDKTNTIDNLSKGDQTIHHLTSSEVGSKNKGNELTSEKLSREQEADLHAQLYLLSQEKRSLEMKLEDRHSLESMLRSHIEHLREENDRLSRGEGRLTSLSREDKLGKRVDSLLETLDRVTKNSDQRQTHSDELMGDLKRANR